LSSGWKSGEKRLISRKTTNIWDHGGDNEKQGIFPPNSNQCIVIW
jgi:hypothetical protein